MGENKVEENKNEESGQVYTELKRAEEFLNDVGMRAVLLEESDMVPLETLLIGLPEEIEKGNCIVCNRLAMDDKDEIEIARYYHLYYEIPMELEKVEKEDMYRAMNTMNTVIGTGHFVYGKNNGSRERVYMRDTIAVDVDETLSPSVLCEAAQYMLQYGAVMEEILAGLAEGMDLDAIFQAESLPREV